MTTEERLTTLTALWRALRTLVPTRSHDALDDLQIAIDATHSDHGDVRATEAYREGRHSVEKELERIRREAFRAGMIAVQKRSDYRDLEDIQDPEELRSTH